MEKDQEPAKTLEGSLKDSAIKKAKSPFYDESGKLKPQYWDRQPGWSSPCTRGMVYDEEGYLIPMDELDDEYGSKRID